MATSAQILERGLKHHRNGELRTAEGLYRDVLRIDPGHSDALHLLGVAALQQQDHIEAVRLIKNAIASRESFAPFHGNLGAALVAMGQLEEGIASYRRAIELDPSNANMFYNLGNALRDQEKFDEAITAYQTALQWDPHHAEAHNNLGEVFKREGELDSAIRAYHHAIQIQPQHADAHYNLANVLKQQELFDEAITSYERAIQIQPDHANALTNLASTFKELGRFDDAKRYYSRAVQIQPDRLQAAFNLSLIDLLQGDFENAWRGYENRWIDGQGSRRDFGIPVWNGTRLNGRTILIYAEQGVGDELMFASCLPEVIDLAAACVLECDPRLVPLFQRSFPKASVISRPMEQTYENVKRLDEADFQIAMGSLPQYLRGNLKSFPQYRQYLKANPAPVEKAQQQLSRLGEGLKVGISWRGGKDPADRRRRSIELEQWLPVFAVPNACFISLQYGDCRDELAKFSTVTGANICCFEEINPLTDLDTFAAYIAALDLVISVDNSTVHLAGALGVAVWTLLPKVPDWRWMLERDDTPWYPSMKLFRQTRQGEWDEVFRQVEQQLRFFKQ